MTPHARATPASKANYGPLLLRAAMLGGCLTLLWLGGRAAGQRYAKLRYNLQMSECRARLRRLANAIQRYQADHPVVAVTQIGPGQLYPRYVHDRAEFLCPMIQEGSPAAQSGQIYSSFTWCNQSPDWPHVRKRRGAQIPVLCCSKHVLAQESDRTVNVARLNGSVEQVKLPFGVDSDEW